MDFPKALFDLNPVVTSNVIDLYCSVPTMCLKVVKARKTKLGDCRVSSTGTIITINDGMTPRQTFVTMIHELAHHYQFMNHGFKVSPHGSEWKMEYKKLMDNFLGLGILDADFEGVIKNHMQNPSASSCRDADLFRTMNPNGKTVGDLNVGTNFMHDNRTFVVIQKLRKNYKCKEHLTDKMFIFSPLASVKTF